MPYRTGFPLCQILILSSFFSLLLAFSFNEPIPSPGGTIHLAWTLNLNRDPDTVFLRITCDTLSTPYARVQAGSHRVSLTVNPVFLQLLDLNHDDCTAIAYDLPDSDAIIAKSSRFLLQDSSSSISSTTMSSKTSFFPSSTSTQDLQGTTNTQTATFQTPSVLSQTTGSDSLSSSISRGGAVVGHQGTLTTTTVTSQVPDVSSQPSQSIKSDTPSSGTLRGALAGGIFGGMGIILLCYAIFVLYSRYKCYLDSKVPRLLEAGLTRASISIPSLDRHYSAYDRTVHPYDYDYTHRPMEGKQERLDRIQQEMEDIQRQRDVLRSDLEARMIMSVNNGRQGDAPVGDIERLRFQIAQINRRIGELESGRQEESPPNYSPMSGH